MSFCRPLSTRLGESRQMSHWRPFRLHCATRPKWAFGSLYLLLWATRATWAFSALFLIFELFAPKQPLALFIFSFERLASNEL
jgi:hypothetical protein